jgi:hypothetical protein
MAMYTSGVGKASGTQPLLGKGHTKIRIVAKLRPTTRTWVGELGLDELLAAVLKALKCFLCGCIPCSQSLYAWRF